jgi:hypothetical protein
MFAERERCAPRIVMGEPERGRQTTRRCRSNRTALSFRDKGLRDDVGGADEHEMTCAGDHQGMERRLP